MITMDREHKITVLNEHHPYYTKYIDTNVQLKKHQLTLLHKCIEYENGEMSDDNYKCVKTNVGILSDKVGSGKSYTILALIKVNREPLVSIHKHNTYGDSNLYVEYSPRVFSKHLEVNIIVCSHTIISQWKYYIETFFRSPKYIIVNKKIKLNEYTNDPDKYDIVLVASNFYKHLAGYLNNINSIVNRVIFDEADSVATPQAIPIPARFYWLITASYHNILYPYPKYGYYFDNGLNRSYIISSGINNNVFVKHMIASMLRSIPQSEHILIDKLVVKNDNSFVSKCFEIPEYVKHVIMCKCPVEVSILDGITSKQIIDCLNGGDLSTAVSYLDPTKLGNEKHIINIVKHNLEVQLSNLDRTIEFTNSLIFTLNEQRDQRLEALNNEKKKLTTKISLLEERISNSHICCICYNEHTNKSVTTCCKNPFCLECICNWLTTNNTCPLCKETINVQNDLYVVYDSSIKQQHTTSDKRLTKLETLYNLLKKLTEHKDSKILIFSEFDNSFVSIIDIMVELNIRYGFLRGVGIHNTLKEYRSNNSIQVLLMNSKSYGSGINLENTTDVILCHKFDHQIEQQVIGRAQRPGRKNTLNVWYLLNDNECK